MKKKYNKPSTVCVRLHHIRSLCTTTMILMNSYEGADHFDARYHEWEDDE